MVRGRGPLGSNSSYAGPSAPEEEPDYRPFVMGAVPGEGRIARGLRLSREAFTLIRDDRGLLGLALDLAWSVATFFVIPALAVDGVGPREALRRSLRTVRRRWAEGASGTVAISGATGVLLLPGVMIGFIGYEDLASKPAAGVVLLAIGIALALPVLVYSSATSAVFTLAVYRYAQDSPACGPFAEADLASPFVGGRKAGKLRVWLGRLRIRKARGL